MGFAAGIVAGLIAFVAAPLLGGWVAPWFGWMVGAAAVVGFLVPVHRHGHRHFQGGNTDLAAYVVVVGIWAAIAVPRWNAARMSCADRDEVGAWLVRAQEGERARTGAYAAALDDLPWADAPYADELLVIEVQELSDTLFRVAVSHPRCSGGEVLSVSTGAR